MGEKGLWAHIEGQATALIPYQMVNAVHVLSDGKTPATKDKVEWRESHIMEHERQEYLAQHIILLLRLCLNIDQS